MTYSRFALDFQDHLINPASEELGRKHPPTLHLKKISKNITHIQKIKNITHSPLNVKIIIAKLGTVLSRHEKAFEKREEYP